MPFTEVVAARRQLHRERLVGEVPLEVEPGALVDEPLREAERDGRTLRELRDDLAGRLSTSAAGTARWMMPHAAASSPESSRPRSSSSLARADADEPGEQPRPAAVGREAARRERLPEAGRRSRRCRSRTRARGGSPSPAAQPRTAHDDGACVASINGISRCACAGSRRWMLPDAWPRVVRRRCGRRCRTRSRSRRPRRRAGWRGRDSSLLARLELRRSARRRHRRRRWRCASRAGRGRGAARRRRATIDESVGRYACRRRSVTRRSNAVGDRPRAQPAGRSAPPGGSGSRTAPCSRLGSRIVAWPGVVISPRWFSPQMSRSTAGRSPSARYFRVTCPRIQCVSPT